MFKLVFSDEQTADVPGVAMAGNAWSLVQKSPVRMSASSCHFHRWFFSSTFVPILHSCRLLQAECKSSNSRLLKVCLLPSVSVMPHPHRFLGNSVLWWDLKNDVTISTPWYLGLVFRTRSREGTLLQAQAGQYTSLLFQVGTHVTQRVSADSVQSFPVCHLLFNQNET